MEKDPLNQDIKRVPFVLNLNLNDKCAEVYRNNNLGTYSFLCFACGEILDSSAADSIFKHLDTHYYFEGEDEQLQVKQEQLIQEELINPFQTEFLDVNQPIIEHLIATSSPIKNEDTFICDICENTFTTKSDLIKHLWEHSTSTSLIDKTAQTNINSDWNGNEEDLYHCDQCDKKYRFIGSLTEHYKRNHPDLVRSTKQPKEKSFNCDQCNKKYRFENNLIRHRNEKHSAESTAKSKKCIDCGKMFKNETRLNAHNCVGLEIKKVYNCDHCNEKYFTKASLKKHNKEKHPELCPPDTTTTTRTFTCDICNETFKTIKSFTKHQNNHSIPFKCNVCDKVFSKNANLKLHLSVHDPSTIKHACNICDKKFRCSQNLKEHIRTHTGEKPYECTICQKRLITLTVLKAHIMRAHTFEKKFQCELCGKNFYTKTKLNEHMRKHNNDRPYKCQFCDEKFFTTAKRKDHERKHTGEKPYKCAECEYTCRTSKGLKQHAILHTGAKPYACKYCDMKFAQTAGRRGHEKSKHGAL